MATTWRALGKCRILMNAAKAKVPKAPAPKVKIPAASAAKVPPTKKPTGIMKPMPISPILQEFIGSTTPEASRAQVIQKVWAYIKLHNLQNEIDKRQIVCDQKLKTLFNGKDTIGFLEVAGLLNQHFVKAG